LKITFLDRTENLNLSPDLCWLGEYADLVVADSAARVNRGGLQSENAIETAVIICLMTDARADATELPAGVENRGWAGDTFDLQNGERALGSKLWLLRRRSLDDGEVVLLAKAYAELSLQTLIAQRVCVRVVAEASVSPDRNRLELDVALYAQDETQIFDRRFSLLWAEVD